MTSAGKDLVHFVRARESGPTETWLEVPNKIDLTDRRSAWRASRKLALYPDLEWTFGIMNARVWVLGGSVPAIFYENITSFDRTNWAVWLGHRTTERRELGPIVEAGFEYFPPAYRTTSGRLELPHDGETLAGRHAVALVGMVDGQLLFRNSWGEGWGDGGYGYISREYFEAHVKTVEVRWASTVGPSPAMNRCLRRREGRSDPRNEDFVECWQSPNEFGVDELLFGGVRHSLITWEVISLETKRPVYIFEWRDPRSVLGRAHVFAPREPDHRYTLRELFIDPRRRRRGHGTFLEEAAADYVAELGGREIDVWIRKPDAMPRCAPASEGFSRARGYSLTDLKPERVDVAAVWRREIG